MDLINIRQSETKTLPFPDMNTIQTVTWVFMINDSFAKHWSYEISKSQLQHLIQFQRGRVQFGGQCFYQQDFQKNSILETEFMCESAARGTAYTWSQFFTLRH